MNLEFKSMVLLSNLIEHFLDWKTKHLTHQQFLMILSAVIGFLAGMVAVILKNLTYLIQLLLENEVIVQYHTAFYFIFPLIGLFLTRVIIRFVLKRKLEMGIPSILKAMLRRKGIMKKFEMYGAIITAPLTVGFGGSVGLESPTVFSGAAISSNLSRLFRMNQASRTLMIGCAAAGAMSSLFNAPIAAIIFAVEVFALDLTLISLIPLLLASVSAVLTSYFFFGSDIILQYTFTDEFKVSEVPYYILLGCLASVCSIYFTKIYFGIGNRFQKIKSSFNRFLLGGLILGILIFFIPPLYGEGYEMINNLLQENYLYALNTSYFNEYLDQIWVVVLLLSGLFLFKIVATSVTLGAGGIGGLFTPVLYLGSTMGHCFALIINNLGILKNPLSVSNFTLVGMAGLLAGIMHAPLTAIFLIAELTSGYELFVPLMITAAISFTLTSQFQPHSVYNMELAREGKVVSHNKDHVVLTQLRISEVIESNFVPLELGMTLGEVVKEGVAKSARNIFPVIDGENKFKGIILLDDLRPIMFNQKLYDEIKVSDIVQAAPEIIHLHQDGIDKIMKKFQTSNAWNLPVVEDDRYIGFVSKSKLLTAYRQKLIEVSVQ